MGRIEDGEIREMEDAWGEKPGIGGEKEGRKWEIKEMGRLHEEDRKMGWGGRGE